MAKGIYKITNDRTGEVYIGQTNNLYFREKQHMENLANGTHHNRGMQEDYNNGDTFSFEILEYVEDGREELHIREQAQIENHNSFYAGYNQTPGGEYDQYKGSYQYGGGRKQTYSSRKNYSTNSASTYKPKATSKSNNDDWSCVLVVIFVFIISGISGVIGDAIFKGLGTLFAFFGIILGIALIVHITEDSGNDGKDNKFGSNNSKRYDYNYNYATPKYESTLDWKICPKCGRKFDNNVKTCSYCNYKLK